jgi:hypothetical protein
MVLLTTQVCSCNKGLHLCVQDCVLANVSNIKSCQVWAEGVLLGALGIVQEGTAVLLWSPQLWEASWSKLDLQTCYYQSTPFLLAPHSLPCTLTGGGPVDL